MIGQGALEQLDTRTDDFLERLPFLPQLDAPRVQTRHVEQVCSQAVQPQRLVANRFSTFALMRCERRLANRKCVSKADQCCQWRAQVVRDRRQDRTAQSL